MLIKWKSFLFDWRHETKMFALQHCVLSLLPVLCSCSARGRICTRHWVDQRDWLGAYHAQMWHMWELRTEDSLSLRIFFFWRRDSMVFYELHQLVTPFINKMDTWSSATETLALILCFLAKGKKECLIS
jgi:hypothetical protein